MDNFSTAQYYDRFEVYRRHVLPKQTVRKVYRLFTHSESLSKSEFQVVPRSFNGPLFNKFFFQVIVDFQKYLLVRPESFKLTSVFLFRVVGFVFGHPYDFAS